MSAAPRSALLSNSTAAEPAAAAAAPAPAAGSKRRVSVELSSDAVQHEHKYAAPMDDAASAAVGSSSDPASLTLAADEQSAAAASLAGSAPSASAPAARKKQRLAQSAAAAPAVIAPPWSTLYSDALHCIFKFASLQDLTRLMSVSRRWGRAVLTMPPIAASVTIASEAQLSRFLDGRMRRHVSSLRHKRDPSSVLWCYDIVSLPELQLISARTPWLSELCVRLPHSDALNGEVEAWCAALSRFRKLRALDVSAKDGHVYDPNSSNRIIETIGGLNPLTLHNLELHLLTLSYEISFEPLAALTCLRYLDISWDNTWADDDEYHELSDEQISELGQLTSVQHLSVPYDDDDQTLFFVRLLQPGHALQLTQLGFSQDPSFVRVTEVLSSLLSSLPSLTSLCAELMCSDVQFLSHLTALTDVNLSDADGSVDPAELVASLRHCTQITELTLSEFALTGGHLEELLPAFSQLDSVTLESLGQLASLRCFNTTALAESLTELQLSDLPLCPTTQITHLFGLRSLQFLNVGGLSVPLTGAQKAELRPHSQRFPQLDHSRCQ